MTPMLARDRRAHRASKGEDEGEAEAKGTKPGNSRADRNGGIYGTGYRDFPRVTGDLGRFLSPRQPESRIRFQPIVASSLSRVFPLHSFRLSPVAVYRRRVHRHGNRRHTGESNRRLWTHLESLLEFSFTSSDRSCDFFFSFFFFFMTLTSTEISVL